MSERLLLDTHVWLWVLTDSPSLTPALRTRVEASSTRAISAASSYEVRLKHRLGKLPLPDAFARDPIRLTRASGIEVMPISAEIAERAAGYAWPHRDPFDRLIFATAEIEDLALVTSDEMLLNILQAEMPSQ
ncbi:MAG: type II toxin-antitoxin system VapC family toxin [Litorimonas sp.]